MASFYVNENFPLPVVKYLRTLGHDVLTSLEAGNASQRIPDEEVLAFSIAQNRILLTLNRRDFIKLHKDNPVHAGIIICTENPNFESLASSIHQEIIAKRGLLENQLIRVYRPL
jgi:predicted nuclease of predicted toxin-antitoxin system